MKLEALEQLVNKTPFTPFRLVTSAGRIYEVPHREHIWLHHVLIGVKNADGTGAFISPDQIVSAEVDRPPNRRKKAA